MRGISFLVLLALVASPAARCAGAAAAAETAPDPKAQAKALYTEVTRGTDTRSGDLWTAIQLEAWAAPQKLSLRGAPILGTSEILGDPLLACPDDVRCVFDRGDALDVLTYRRYHQLAPDGRPLSPSIAFGLRCDRGDVAFDRGYVAAIYFEGREEGPQHWLTRVLSLPDGKQVMDADIEEPAATELGDGDAKVANDGTAVAVCLHKIDSEQSRVVVAVGKQRKAYDDMIAPIGVASGGAWLLANVVDGENSIPALVVGADRTRLKSAAVGPGIAAIITLDNAIQILDKDAKRLPLVVPMSIGVEPRVMTVGRWLVVCSGRGAKSEDNTDMLGGVLPDSPQQPETIALFRWDDLAEKKQIAVQCYQAPLEVARHQAAGLYVWHDKQVDIIDLLGRQPVAKPFWTGPKDIGYAYSTRFWSVVSYRGGTTVSIIDDQGREQWNGEGDINVWYRDVAVITHKGDSPSYDLVHLAPEAKDRKSVRLKLEAGAWTFNCDPYHNRLLARQNRQWVLIDLTTGAVLSQGQGRKTRPDVGYNSPPLGRFYFRFGRLYAKSTGEESAEAERLYPQDGWMLGRVALVLTREDRVLMTGHAKKGEYKDVGTCPGSAHFGVVKEELVITNWDLRVLGSIIPSPTPFRAEPPPGRDGDMPPEGPWRVNNNATPLEFAPPHGGVMTWSDERAGFTPKWLRSPKLSESQGLLLVTSSLIINLDPSVAKLVSRR